MKKYIVSIEQADSPRLQSFLNQDFIKSYVDEFKIVGFNAYQQSAKDYFQQAVLGRVQPLTLGEWGCTKSHLLCMEDFLASDEQYALIFEDDAIQTCAIDLKQLEQEVQHLALASPFLLSLGGVQMKICKKVKGKLLDNVLFERKILHVHPYFYERMHFTYAYIVDRKMAQVLLNYHTPIQICDHWQGLMNENVHFYMTYLFDHPDLDENQNMSYIEQERNMKYSEKIVSLSHIEKIKMQINKLSLNSYPQ